MLGSCPLCNKSNLETIYLNSSCRVYCPNCEIIGPPCFDEEGAIDRWNTYFIYIDRLKGKGDIDLTQKFLDDLKITEKQKSQINRISNRNKNKEKDSRRKR